MLQKYETSNECKQYYNSIGESAVEACRNMLSMDSHAYLELGSHTVDVMASLAGVAQQHVLGIALLATHLAAGIQDGLGPGDAALQGGEVQEDLRQAGAAEQGLPPAVLHRLADASAVTGVWGRGCQSVPVGSSWLLCSQSTTPPCRKAWRLLPNTNSHDMNLKRLQFINK